MMRAFPAQMTEYVLGRGKRWGRLGGRIAERVRCTDIRCARIGRYDLLRSQISTTPTSRACSESGVHSSLTLRAYLPLLFLKKCSAPYVLIECTPANCLCH